MNLPSKINFIDWNIGLRSLINPNNNKIFQSPSVIGYKHGTINLRDHKKYSGMAFLAGMTLLSWVAA